MQRRPRLGLRFRFCSFPQQFFTAGFCYFSVLFLSLGSSFSFVPFGISPPTPEPGLLMGMKHSPYVLVLMFWCYPACSGSTERFSGEAHRKVLEEPRPHDVGGHFGENAPLLVVLLLFVGVVVVPRARRSHAVVQAVTCHVTANRKSRSVSFIRRGSALKGE